MRFLIIGELWLVPSQSLSWLALWLSDALWASPISLASSYPFNLQCHGTGVLPAHSTSFYSSIGIHYCCCSFSENLSTLHQALLKGLVFLTSVQHLHDLKSQVHVGPSTSLYPHYTDTPWAFHPSCFGMFYCNNKISMMMTVIFAHIVYVLPK